jgi:mannobiose 2-epimerase
MINYKHVKHIYFYIILLYIFSSCTTSEKSEETDIADEMQQSLQEELLNAWYPLTIDSAYGGFLSYFTYDWQLGRQQDKMLVTQSRHVWTASQAALFFNDTRYQKIAEHGFHFLRDRLWDADYGGFYMLRNREGGPVDDSYLDEKRTYGIVFAIYGLAGYYAVSGDTAALNLAKKTFYWLDLHGRDPKYGGYFNHLTREGGWLFESDIKTIAGDSMTAAYKDYNSSIHILEAFTELFRVWPDSLLRERLQEMFILIRDTFTREKGYLQLYFRRDWTPVTFMDSSDKVREANYGLEHVTFGHDVETGYLLLEASHALGSESDTKTATIAKKMVDHALAKGWDEEIGGFYYEGSYLTGSDSVIIINTSKSWWVQAEGLNALLLMAKLFPQEERYWKLFVKQWEYIKEYMIDHEHGGWYIRSLDQCPDCRESAKASNWKVNYHNTRTLINCIKMLRSEHELLNHNIIPE